MRRAILTPWVDLLCSGGLSILVCAGFLLWSLFDPPKAQRFDFNAFLIFSFLINYPHFMASYRLLYDSKKNVKRYPWASIYIPAALVAVSVSGFLFARGTDDFISRWTVAGLGTLAAMYLAWHYTGQAWGMTASFAWIAGVRFDKKEFLLIRTTTRIWLTWHVIWAITQVRGTFPPAWEDPVLAIAEPLYGIVYIVALASLPFGAAGFLLARHRTGRLPPWRAIVPWAALYFWYPLIDVYPNALILVQLFHALQYLPFTARVDLNRYERHRPPEKTRPLLHLAVYYGILLLMVGVVYCIQFVPKSIDPHVTLFATVLACINIHHYFVDGCVWKISNREVRKDLFAHLQAN